MSDNMVTELEAAFSRGSQWAELIITQADDGMYEVHGKSVRSCGERLRGSKTTICEGRLYEIDVKGLVEKIEELNKGIWWHHYRSQVSYMYLNNLYKTVQDTWHLKITYANGKKRRWDGRGDGPSNIVMFYKLLLSYGMPKVDSLPHVLPSDSDYRELTRLNDYIDLLHEAYESGNTEEASLLESEFIEDSMLYVQDQGLDISAEKVLAAWGVDTSAQGLSSIDVSHAPRAQMMALFWTLGRLDDPHEVLMRLQERGVLRAWVERMDQLPAEEAEERRREEELERKRLIEAIHETIRKRVESDVIFTSADIAEDVGATKQQVTAHIRKFVKQGKVQVVGNEYPRRYRAA